MFPNGAFDSRCNLRWKAYWFGNFTTEEPYDWPVSTKFQNVEWNFPL